MHTASKIQAASQCEAIDDSTPASNSHSIQPTKFDDLISLKDKIDRLEAELFKSPHQIEIKTTHTFAKGLYAREIFIPKGTLLTGKVHKHEHLNIVSLGDITVLTEDGLKRIQAPCTLVSRPGTKRVGFAHEDTVWTTVHATDETDLEKLEAELVESTPAIEARGAECLGLL